MHILIAVAAFLMRRMSLVALPDTTLRAANCAVRTAGLALLLCLCHDPVHAGTITWIFSGSMNDTGELFTGRVSFDNARPDLNSSPERGDFKLLDLSQGDLALHLNGNFVFASETHVDGRVPDWIGEIDVINDLDAKGDLIRFIYNVVISPPQFIPDLFEYGAELFFIDETGMWLTDAGLPDAINLAALSLNPNINGWGNHFGLTSAAVLRLRTSTRQGQQFRLGTITSVTPVPEPTSLLLVGIGCASLIGPARRWKKQRNQ